MVLQMAGEGNGVQEGFDLSRLSSLVSAICFVIFDVFSYLVFKVRATPLAWNYELRVTNYELKP